MPDLGREPSVKEDPQYNYEGWSRGYNTYQPANKIRVDEMPAAQNIELFANTVEKRRGAQYVGNSKDSRTRGLAVYTHEDGTKKIIRASGDSIQEYNPSTGNYDDLTGKTYTSDLNTEFVQAYDDLYINNGTDQLTKYNKDTTPVITEYEEIDPPTTPSSTRDSGLAAGQYTAYFKLTHFNEIGETQGTTEFSVTYDKPRIQWDGVTEKLDLTWTVDAGVDASGGTNVYFSDTPGDETYVDTISGTTNTWAFLGGEVEPDRVTEPPETNSTSGVICKKMVFDGVRLWGIKGSAVNYSGGGTQDIDHFDSGSGGGSINVARGDGDEITNISVTRDRKVIIYKQFSIWQVFFDSAGLINLQLINPLVGTVGTRSVAIVDDDQVFFSRYGIFTLGNQPNFPTDVLRIKSISVPIDKDLEKITPSNLPNVVLHYDFRRRLRLAYSQGGSTSNNAEFIYKFGSWVPNKGINANCYLNLVDRPTSTPIIDENNKQYTLFGTEDEGRVAQLDKGYSDMGDAIDGFFDTRQDDQGQPERYKKYYDQDLEIGRIQGSVEITQSFDTGNDVRVIISNQNTGGVGAEAVGFSQVGLEIGTVVTGSSVSLNKRWRLYGRQQRHIRTRFRENSSNGTFSILRFSGVYRIKSRRQYPSQDILTTTEV